MILLKLFSPLGNDFVVYFEAAKMFLIGANPYRGLLTRTFPFNYPPSSLLFLWPLGFFDYVTANIIWNVASLVAVLVAIALMLKIATGRASWVAWVILSFVFTVMFFPVKFNIGNAQINHFILLLVVLGLYCYRFGRKNWSALFLAFASGIKLAPVIFVLYFIIKKDWGQVVRFVVCLIAVFLAPIIFVPINFQIDYYRDILPLSFTLGAKDWYYNQSLFGFLARAFSNGSFINALFYLLSGIIVFLTWWRGRKIPKLRVLAAVSSLYLILHPIALQHYFGFAIIPLILLLDRRDWLVLVISYLLLAVDIKNFAAVPKEFNFILSHDFYGIFALWVLALWREKFWMIMAGLWVTTITVSYLFVLLCHAKFCF